jgi:hypothetical protein
MSSSNQNIFEQFKTAKKQSGKFLKLPSNEEETLQFKVNKIQIVDSQFKAKRTAEKSI